MKTPASYSAPLVVSMTVVGWLTWTYLEPPTSLSTAKVKITRIEAALLSPKLNPVSARDPFLLAGKVAKKPGSLAAAGTTKVAAATDPNRLRSFWTELTGLWNRTSQELVSRAKLAAQARAAVAEQVRLSATSIGGRRRLATLNDRIFAEGEVIDALGTLSGPIVLTHVRSGSVTLRYLGSPAVVTFASLVPAANSAPSPAVKPPQAVKPPPRSTKTKPTQARRPSGGRP